MYSFTMKCPACSEPCSWSHKNSDYNLEFFCRNKHRNICTLLQFNEQKIPKLNEHKIKYDEYCSDCKENMCTHCDNKHKEHKKEIFFDSCKTLKKQLSELKKKKKEFDKLINDLRKEFESKLLIIQKSFEIYFELKNNFEFMTKEKLDMLIALNMNFIIDFENIKNIAKEKNIIKTLESINQLSDKISNNPSIPNKKENFEEKINTTQNDKIKRYELDISKNFFVINNNKTKHIFEITKVENINIIKIKECIILPQKQKELEIKAEKRSEKNISDYQMIISNTKKENKYYKCFFKQTILCFVKHYLNKTQIFNNNNIYSIFNIYHNINIVDIEFITQSINNFHKNNFNIKNTPLITSYETFESNPDNIKYLPENNNFNDCFYDGTNYLLDEYDQRITTDEDSFYGNTKLEDFSVSLINKEENCSSSDSFKQDATFFSETCNETQNVIKVRFEGNNSVDIFKPNKNVFYKLFNEKFEFFMYYQKLKYFKELVLISSKNKILFKEIFWNNNNYLTSIQIDDDKASSNLILIIAKKDPKNFLIPSLPNNEIIIDKNKIFNDTFSLIKRKYYIPDKIKNIINFINKYYRNKISLYLVKNCNSGKITYIAFLYDHALLFYFKVDNI